MPGSLVAALHRRNEVLFIRKMCEKFTPFPIDSKNIVSQTCKKSVCVTNRFLQHNRIILSLYTVEPPNKGHFGTNGFVPCREVVPISEVKYYKHGAATSVLCREVVPISEVPLGNVIERPSTSCKHLFHPQWQPYP